MEEQFLKACLDLFHDWKKGLKWDKMYERLRELLNIANRSDDLREKVSLEDIRESFLWAHAYLRKPLLEITDSEFIGCIKSEIFTTKTYDFYYPIYNLYNFPNNIKLGFSTVLTFENLPKEIQDDFTSRWKNDFKIFAEEKTEDEYLGKMKASTFLHLVVMANGTYKAMETAYSLAQDSVHVLRFLYKVHFPITLCLYRRKCLGYAEAGVRFYGGVSILGSASYSEEFAKSISELTNILTKPNPEPIERKMKNALRIFGIQTSITVQQVRFVLLITCLESLLLTGHDRDYILWKLAEKTALLLGKNKRKINDYVKSAYKKRSAFIHGEKPKDTIIEESDIHSMENIIVPVFWKLNSLRKQGYVQIRKNKNVKSIDGYIEETKFGKD